jgi:hypothetical protein
MIPHLQNLDFPFDFLLLDRLEDLDDAFGIVHDIHAFEDLTVFPPTNLAYHFVLFLIAPIDRQGLVIPIFAGPVDVHVRVDSGKKARPPRCLVR